MAKATIMTAERCRMAEELYKGGITVTDIAKTLGVSRPAVYSWIRVQEWYTFKNNSKADIIKRDLQCRTMDPFAANEQKQKGYFVIPWRLPGMNDFIAALSSSRYRGGALKRTYENDIVLCAKAGLDYDGPYPCAVHLRLHFVESNARRDYDNIQSGQKFILDALQTAGVIANDDQKHVLPSEYFFSVDPKYPRVEVEIIPHPDMPVSTKQAPKKRCAPVKEIKNHRSILVDGRRYLLQMDKGEILRSYEQSGNKEMQILVLAQLNAVPKKVIQKVVNNEV